MSERSKSARRASKSSINNKHGASQPSSKQSSRRSSGGASSKQRFGLDMGKMEKKSRKKDPEEKEAMLLKL